MSEEIKDGDKNPVIKVIGGIKIRKDNYIKVRYNEYEYERLARICVRTGISIAKIIALSSQPCPVCDNDHVTITIPLGQISTKKVQTSGINNKQKIQRNDNYQG